MFNIRDRFLWSLKPGSVERYICPKCILVKLYFADSYLFRIRMFDKAAFNIFIITYDKSFSKAHY